MKVSFLPCHKAWKVPSWYTLWQTTIIGLYSHDQRQQFCNSANLGGTVLLAISCFSWFYQCPGLIWSPVVTLTPASCFRYLEFDGLWPCTQTISIFVWGHRQMQLWFPGTTMAIHRSKHLRLLETQQVNWCIVLASLSFDSVQLFSQANARELKEERMQCKQPNCLDCVCVSFLFLAVSANFSSGSGLVPNPGQHNGRGEVWGYLDGNHGDNLLKRSILAEKQLIT